MIAMLVVLYVALLTCPFWGKGEWWRYVNFGIGLTGVILISTVMVEFLDFPVLRKPYRPYSRWPDYVPTDSDNDEEVDDL
jgi:hypothetical protein